MHQAKEVRLRPPRDGFWRESPLHVVLTVLVANHRARSDLKQAAKLWLEHSLENRLRHPRARSRQWRTVRLGQLQHQPLGQGCREQLGMTMAIALHHLPPCSVRRQEGLLRQSASAHSRATRRATGGCSFLDPPCRFLTFDK
jgi:hypothetical protein